MLRALVVVLLLLAPLLCLASAQGDPAPVAPALGIAFDISNSFRSYLRTAQDDVQQLLESLEVGDNLTVMSFGDRQDVLHRGRVADASAVGRLLVRINALSVVRGGRSGGSTDIAGMLQVLINTLALVAPSQPWELLILSDGQGDSSRGPVDFSVVPAGSGVRFLYYTVAADPMPLSDALAAGLVAERYNPNESTPFFRALGQRLLAAPAPSLDGEAVAASGELAVSPGPLEEPATLRERLQRLASNLEQRLRTPWVLVPAVLVVLGIIALVVWRLNAGGELRRELEGITQPDGDAPSLLLRLTDSAGRSFEVEAVPGARIRVDSDPVEADLPVQDAGAEVHAEVTIDRRGRIVLREKKPGTFPLQVNGKPFSSGEVYSGDRIKLTKHLELRLELAPATREEVAMEALVAEGRSSE
ncbi:MAG: hypothetical protein HY335_00460 [Deinococcus sp.]|nr:hypothetical protein [Deinococcus sp.]